VKDYIIWLKCGQSMQGTMTEEEVDKLQEWASSTPDTPGEFRDTDGAIFIAPGQLAALSINKPEQTSKIGF